MKLAEDRKAILFLTNEGEIIARTDGDCCSSSWIENVELPAMGFPATVIGACDLHMPNSGQEEDNDDVIRYYGFKIQTDRGDIVIDYRNSSNGYYGGDLIWPGEHFYGGVYGQNVSEEIWKEIHP